MECNRSYLISTCSDHTNCNFTHLRVHTNIFLVTFLWTSKIKKINTRETDDSLHFGEELIGKINHQKFFFFEKLIKKINRSYMSFQILL